VYRLAGLARLSLQHVGVCFPATAGLYFTAGRGAATAWTFEPGDVFLFGGPDGNNLDDGKEE
jgi:hypothetical protein